MKWKSFFKYKNFRGMSNIYFCEMIRIFIDNSFEWLPELNDKHFLNGSDVLPNHYLLKNINEISNRFCPHFLSKIYLKCVYISINIEYLSVKSASIVSYLMFWLIFDWMDGKVEPLLLSKTRERRFSSASIWSHTLFWAKYLLWL